jgi:hypothetical protein
VKAVNWEFLCDKCEAIGEKNSFVVSGGTLFQAKKWARKNGWSIEEVDLCAEHNQPQPNKGKET